MKEDGNGLSELPQGWVRTTVGEIVTFEYGKGLRQDKRDSSGKIPVYGSNGVVGYHSTPLVEAPCLIVGRKGAAGQVHISNGPCWPIDTTYYVISPEGIDLSFIYYLLSTLRLGSLDRSTAIPGLNRNDAYALSIPLPPLPEQQRIVAKIEELFTQLDAGVAALEKAEAQLRRYRQAVLKAAVEGELTREWHEAHQGELEPASVLLERILKERRTKWEAEQLEKMRAKGKEPKDDRWKQKYKGPWRPEIDELPQLPVGWTWTSFEELSEATPHALKAGPFGSSLKKEYYVPSGYKIYGQEQVIRGDPFYGDYYIDEERYENLKSCVVKPGDILISLVGTIGRVLILPEGIEPGIINPRLVKLSLDKRLVSAKYIKTYLGSSSVRHYFSLSSHGGTMDILNLTILKSLPIPLPPLREQQTIVDEVERCISIADEFDRAVEQSLKRAERLRQSILKRAFEGKLVPQDPSDEPASVLLERIQAEKAGPAVERKTKRKGSRKGRKAEGLQQLELF